jgi:hypothetical protein
MSILDAAKQIMPPSTFYHFSNGLREGKTIREAVNAQLDAAVEKDRLLRQSDYTPDEDTQKKVDAVLKELKVKKPDRYTSSHRQVSTYSPSGHGIAFYVKQHDAIRAMRRDGDKPYVEVRLIKHASPEQLVEDLKALYLNANEKRLSKNKELTDFPNKTTIAGHEAFMMEKKRSSDHKVTSKRTLVFIDDQHTLSVLEERPKPKVKAFFDKVITILDGIKASFEAAIPERTEAFLNQIADLIDKFRLQPDKPTLK